MVGLGGRFDANAKENNPSNCVPEGQYTVCWVEDEERSSKKPNGGSYLNVQFEIVDGKFRGRKFFEMLGINLASEKASEIARGRLSAICRACNKDEIDDTSELCGIPFQVILKVKSDEYGEKNYIAKVVEKAKGQGPVAPRPAPPPASNRRPVHQTIEDDEIPF